MCVRARASRARHKACDFRPTYTSFRTCLPKVASSKARKIIACLINLSSGVENGNGVRGRRRERELIEGSWTKKDGSGRRMRSCRVRLCAMKRLKWHARKFLTLPQKHASNHHPSRWERLIDNKSPMRREFLAREVLSSQKRVCVFDFVPFNSLQNERAVREYSVSFN